MNALVTMAWVVLLFGSGRTAPISYGFGAGSGLDWMVHYHANELGRNDADASDGDETGFAKWTLGIPIKEYNVEFINGQDSADNDTSPELLGKYLHLKSEFLRSELDATILYENHVREILGLTRPRFG